MILDRLLIATDLEIYGKYSSRIVTQEADAVIRGLEDNNNCIIDHWAMANHHLSTAKTLDSLIVSQR